MNDAGNDRDVSERFSQLLTAIRASHDPQDMTDRIRDALDRRTERLSDGGAVFIEGSFAVDDVLYESGTTQILRVTQRDLGDCFAIKTMPPGKRDDQLLAQRLRREAKIGLGLRHPAVQETSALLRLRDGRPGLLQPWAPVSLASLLKTRNLRPEEILGLLHTILQALSFLHGAGYVHCDVTAGNIMMPEEDLAKARLGDFGITLRTGERHRDLGLAIAGSPEFSAPEQLAGAPAHPVQDIYAVGRLATRLMADQRSDNCPVLTVFRDTCTHENAAQRPQSADEALNLLNDDR
ncbi:type VI secretion system protein ImpN [Rhizobium skierniewicense]|uniref:Type VI secretion system protein ImpN n=1 Tax=Rhizobium skierniewicense TaxID=984260 RepID=A0A7W6C3Y1_9HYPH|nr:protein kinase [Rhizobium skierniewicense]MBB3944351.1 type VI secretion system protein ImpN [Rhizobium skierniewicense]